ncbi:hypothetical protein M378DRAFT_158788 [Amanita muscaria Koide BX008]|uniref:Uncharacterized protein n=1 Tax=Amanita muscaria (strain Koide BX008) TaxID=946122 RepID=A0A0C2XFN4_AMAMK|nr:hypothetical protein M378DRAFT_158788 [Amanita muscaria Koide BX008]
MAMNRSFLGRTMLTTLSVYLKISTIISSSVSGAGCKTVNFCSRKDENTERPFLPDEYRDAQCRSCQGIGNQIPHR